MLPPHRSSLPRVSRLQMLRMLLRVLVVVAAFLVCSCGGSTARRVRAENSSQFAVLDREGTDDDLLPSDLVVTLKQSVQPEFTSEDLTLARRVLPETPAWLLPSAKGELCLVTLNYALITVVRGMAQPPAASGECVSEREARLGRLVLLRSLATTPTSTNQRTQVIGIVPDGVRTVIVDGGAPPATSVDVSRNAYTVAVSAPRRIHYQAVHDGRLATIAVPVKAAVLDNQAPTAGPAGIPRG